MQPSNGARCLIFGRSLHLHPYFLCANSEGSGETVQMRRIARAFAGRLCDKYHALSHELAQLQTLTTISEAVSGNGLFILVQYSCRCFTILRACINEPAHEIMVFIT